MTTTNLQELADAIYMYAGNSGSIDNIKGIIGREPTDGETRWIADLGPMIESKDYTDLDCDDEAKLIACQMLAPSIQEIAETASIEEGLQLDIVETTEARNGYPSNVANAITGFTSWEQAKQFAYRYNLSLIWIDRRDGWNLWHRGDSAWEPMTITEEDYGDGAEFFSSEEQAFERMKGELEWADCIDLVRSMVDFYGEVIEECSTLGEDEVVLTFDKMVEGKISTKAIEWQYDTHHIALAAIQTNHGGFGPHYSTIH